MIVKPFKPFKHSKKPTPTPPFQGELLSTGGDVCFSFDVDAKWLHVESGTYAIISGMLIQLQPTPSHPKNACSLAVEALKQFKNHRQLWYESEAVTCMSWTFYPEEGLLKNIIRRVDVAERDEGNECCSTVATYHATEKTLHLSLPHRSIWDLSGLEWLHGFFCCARSATNPRPWAKKTCDCKTGAF